VELFVNDRCAQVDQMESTRPRSWRDNCNWRLPAGGFGRSGCGLRALPARKGCGGHASGVGSWGM